AGSTTASSPANRSPPARRGESGSPTNSAAYSSTTLPRAGSPFTTPAEPSASPAKPCCRRSSAASWKPSSPAPAAATAYVSTCPAPPTPYSDHDNQRKEQCDHASKQSAMSPSTNQVVPVQVTAALRSAVWQPRPGRNPCEWSENLGS